MSKERRLAELRERIREISPAEAERRMGQGARLVDVREEGERAGGSVPGAALLGRGFLELRVEESIPDKQTPVICMCAGGTRSLFAAESLLQLGYQDVVSLAGGFEAWQREGRAVAVAPGLSPERRQRFDRHLRLPEVGEAGQLRLQASRVLLVGVGGLGSPVALYLAAAGVGRLDLVDPDRVDRSNLQRQVLHQDGAVGTPKVESGRRQLLALDPHLEVVPHPVRLAAENVDALFEGVDVVVDGSDNFATRYLVNDACVRHGIPNVHGSIFRFEGQVSVFHPAWKSYPARRPLPPGERAPCYRCLYPEPPPASLAPNCAEAGVLGVLPGVVGMLEAVETVKLLLGLGDPLIGRLLCYDALTARFTEMELSADPDCSVCAPGREFTGYQLVSESCGS